MVVVLGGDHLIMGLLTSRASRSGDNGSYPDIRSPIND